MKRLIHKLLFKWFGIETIKNTTWPSVKGLNVGDVVYYCSLSLDAEPITKQCKILFKFRNTLYVIEVKND